MCICFWFMSKIKHRLKYSLHQVKINCVSRKQAQFSVQSEGWHTAINPMVQAGALVQLNITNHSIVQGCLTGKIRKLSGKERRERGVEFALRRSRGYKGAKGRPGVWKNTAHRWLYVVHTALCCKHRDKPWFSWRPAAAEHGQNEQKNKRMVKQGVRAWANRKGWSTQSSHTVKMRSGRQFVQLSVCQPPPGQRLRLCSNGHCLLRGITSENGHYCWCGILSQEDY